MLRRSFRLELPHGVLTTPFFMPDATRAVVRGMRFEEVKRSGIEALVVNTYHLMLRPGADHIDKQGGIHSFMRWPHPVLSDSGGYQVYSLIHRHGGKGKVTEEAVEFASPLDGRKHVLTPELSIAIQFALGVDMMVCLDDPRPNDAPYEDIDRAVERSIRWTERCKEEYDRQVQRRELVEEKKPLLFGVVQGGPYRDLRKKSADALVEMNLHGYGFGALHIDKEGKYLDDIMEYTASLLPEDRPRFALGVGTPNDIARSFAYGWDMFDCVIPTREGRHGRAFHIDEEKCLLGEKDIYITTQLTTQACANDMSVIEEGCACETCARGYSRAYIHYLFRSGDVLGPMLVSLHNLFVYSRLMKCLRIYAQEKGAEG